VFGRLRSEAFERSDAAVARRGLQLVERADTELLVQQADLLEAELRDAQELEDSGRILRA